MNEVEKIKQFVVRSLQALSLYGLGLTAKDAAEITFLTDKQMAEALEAYDHDP